jgi:hypothetical protein
MRRMSATFFTHRVNNEVFMTNPVQVPEQMSEEEARRFVELHTPRFNKVRDIATANKALVEEARRKIEDLQNQAQILFKTRDEQVVANDCEKNRFLNGKGALTWIRGVEECERLSQQVRSIQPGR